MQIQTPDWVKHSVFYQIFPDRFAKGEHPTLISTSKLEPWDELPTLQGYKGGNLWGVIERLDYLQDLGINAIYFTPIFQSACNHRYHTHDYYQVDPLLGGNEALFALIQAAHQREMKIVLDGVFNHCSRGFFFFNDILENGPHSPWLDWFTVTGWPLSPYDGSKPANYQGWEGNRALPEFNHYNSQVREYLMQIAEYWLHQGIDGWRLDVPFDIQAPGFWQEFRDRVKAVNPDAYIVGEVWRDSRYWLDGTQFDGVMNYLFTGPTLAFTAGDRVIPKLVAGPDYDAYPPLDAASYAAKIEHLLQLYHWEIQLTQLNLLDSHDTARAISIANDDKASVELATLLLMTFPGAPSIYYGDEVGLRGGIDPDSRRAFPPESAWERDVLDYHKRLIALRHQHPALRIGTYQILDAEGMGYAFARILEERALIVAANAGQEATTLRVDIADLPSQERQVLYGTAEIAGDEGVLSLKLPPRSGCILG